jgi:maltooligosyltrehalose trehalohydrolase
LDETKALVRDPALAATFEACKLDFSEREQPGHAEALALHHDLLRLRREDPHLSNPWCEVQGAVLGNECFILRYFGWEYDDRLLIVNLGADLHLNPAPEPLLAPPDEQHHWSTLWTSEDPRYGGCGTPPLEGEDNWRIPGQTAVVMAPRAVREGPHG